MYVFKRYNNRSALDIKGRRGWPNRSWDGTLMNATRVHKFLKIVDDGVYEHAMSAHILRSRWWRHLSTREWVHTLIEADDDVAYELTHERICSSQSLIAAGRRG